MIVHIVEDDEAVADALATALEGHDRQSVTYRDGESFLTTAAPSPDDWVIVDIGLPGKNGAEVVRELMSRENPPSVVAISGKPRVKLLRQLKEMPDLRVLRKPLSIETLMAALG
ncbi:MAG: hypothetical protein Tsb0019_02130 [Roseibium sp.]